MSVILLLRRLRQGDFQLEASLIYRVNSRPALDTSHKMCVCGGGDVISKLDTQKRSRRK